MMWYKLVLTTRRWLIGDSWNFVQCFIVIWKCAFCRDRRIQLFSYELSWIQEGWQVLKSLCSFFFIDTGVETWNFVQCHFHLEMCILSGREDPIISYGASKLALTSPSRCFTVIYSSAHFRDRRIHLLFFYELWWIQKEWKIWNSLCSRLPTLWLIKETWNFVQCFIAILDIHIFWQKDPILTMVDPKGVEDVK
jgi:hypothetical protein